jgi:hypothetical protein
MVHTTVHVVAMAYIKDKAPEIIDKGFKAGETWCQQLLLELNLVRRKCTTMAAKLPADIERKKERLTCQVGIWTLHWLWRSAKMHTKSTAPELAVMASFGICFRRQCSVFG